MTNAWWRWRGVAWRRRWMVDTALGMSAIAKACAARRRRRLIAADGHG